MAMRSGLLTVVVTATATLIISSVASAQFEDTSILATDPSPLELDLGTVTQGEEVMETFLVFNAAELFGAAPLEWSVSADQPWISFEPQNGTIEGTGETNGTTVTVRIDTSNLSSGSQRATITLDSNATVSPTTIEGQVRLSVSGERTGTAPPSSNQDLTQYDENHNCQLDNPEFFTLIDDWVAEKIPNSLFFTGIDAWIQKTDICKASSSGQGISLDMVTAQELNSGQAVQFRALGAGITAVKVDIYTLTGERIFSGKTTGSVLRWNLTTRAGSPVANGVYLYRATVEGPTGQIVHSEMNKLVVMR